MNIDELLHKYFEGQSSLEEENMLIRYFSQDDIAETHKPYAPMFRFLIEERQSLLSDSFEEERKAKRKAKQLFFRVASIAACFIAVIISGVIWARSFNFSNRSVVYVDGVRVLNKELIHDQALFSISRIVYVDEETIDTQIDMLDLFTE